MDLPGYKMPDTDGTLAALLGAISGQESGGDYSARSSVGALGRWQIMPANIGQWSADVLGKALTPDEFYSNPHLQDRIGVGKLTEFYNNNLAISSSPLEAAQRTALQWYTGRNDPQRTKYWWQKPSSGPSGRDYVAQVTQRMGGQPQPALGWRQQSKDLDAKVAAIMARGIEAMPRPELNDGPEQLDAPQPVPTLNVNTSNVSTSNVPTQEIPFTPTDLSQYRIAPKNISPAQDATRIPQPKEARDFVSESQNYSKGRGHQGEAPEEIPITEAEAGFKNDYASSPEAQKLYSEKEYLRFRKNIAARIELSKQGVMGWALSTLIPPPGSGPAESAESKYTISTINSLTGGAVRALNPKAYEKAQEANAVGGLQDIVAEGAGALTGTIVGLKGTGKVLEKLALPLIERMGEGVKLAIEGMTLEAPGHAVSVIKGDESIGEALKQEALTGIEFGLMPPIAEGSKAVAAETGVPATALNIAGQATVPVAAALVQGQSPSPEALIENVALSYAMMKGHVHPEEASEHIPDQPVQEVSFQGGKNVEPIPGSGRANPESSSHGDRVDRGAQTEADASELSSAQQSANVINSSRRSASSVGESLAEAQSRLVASSAALEESAPDAALASSNPAAYKYQKSQYDELLRSHEEIKSEYEALKTNDETRQQIAKEKLEAPLTDKQIAKIHQPMDIEDAVLSHIINGGSFDLEDVRRLSIGEEAKIGGKGNDYGIQFTQVANNHGDPIDLFVSERIPEILGHEVHDQIDAGNEVLNIISTLGSRQDAITRLADKYRDYYNPPIPEHAIDPVAQEEDDSFDFGANKEEHALVADEEPAFNVKPTVNGNRWYRGTHEGNTSAEDKFYSTDKSVASDFGTQKTGEEASIAEISDNEKPQNPLTVGSKEELAQQMGFNQDDIFIPEKNFDAEAKSYAASKGHDAIIYESGTFDEPELHVFGKSEPSQTYFERMPPDYVPYDNAEPSKMQWTEGQPAYTYQVVEDKSGNPIAIGEPISGTIRYRTVNMRDKNGKIMKDENGNFITESLPFLKSKGRAFIKVDQFTTPLGRGHELTNSMRSDNAQSMFIGQQLAEMIGGNLNEEAIRVKEKVAGGKATGSFAPKTKSIELSRASFADPNLSSGVLFHEIGHLADYTSPNRFIPSRFGNEGQTFDRGNTLGHVLSEIHSVRQWFSQLTSTEPEYQDFNARDLRNELRTLSSEWSPYPPEAGKKYIEYRNSNKELIADAFSAKLNNPELVARLAPKFDKLFDEFISRKPEVAEAFRTLHDAMHGDKEALGKMKLEFNDSMFHRAETQRLINIETEKEMRTYGARPLRKVAQAFNAFSPADRAGAKMLRDSDAFLKQAGLGNAKQRLRALEAYANAKENGRITDLKYSKAQLKALDQALNMRGGALKTHAMNIANQLLRLNASRQEGMVVYDFLDPIYSPLEEAGIGLSDIGSYAMETGVMGEYRAGKANPGLGDTISADAALRALKTKLGDEKYKLLEAKVANLREFHYKKVEEYHQLGGISDEMMNTVKRNADSYARFSAAEYAGKNVRLSRKSVTGMTGDTSNPFINLAMQTLDLESHINMQRSTREAVKYLQQYEPETITDIKGTEKTPVGKGEIGLHDQGVWKRYAVDPMWADMYHYMPQSWTGPNASMLMKIGAQSLNFQRALLINYSWPFQLKNIGRDLRSFTQTQGFSALPGYARNIKESWETQHGRETPSGLGAQAARTGTIRLYDQLRAEKASSASEMLRHGIGLPLEGIHKRSGLGRTIDALRTGGKAAAEAVHEKAFAKSLFTTFEAVPKISAYEKLIRDGYTPEEATYWGSLTAGTPDTRVRGKATQTANTGWLFFNVNYQGASRASMLLRNPYTRTGFFTRTLLTEVMPKAIIWSIASGAATKWIGAAMGDNHPLTQSVKEAEEMYKYLPSDAMRRYIAVPLGWTTNAQGKRAVKFFTLVHEEMGLQMWDAIAPILNSASGENRNMGDFWRDYGSRIMSQLPNERPDLLIAAQMVGYFFKGTNPHNDFYQRNVLSDEEFAISKVNAFDTRPLSALAAYSGDQLFGSSYRMFSSWYDKMFPDNTAREKPFTFMGYYSETRGGITEKEAKERTILKAQAAEHTLEKRDILDEADKEGEQIISDALIDGRLNDKEAKNLLKKLEVPKDERKYMSISTGDLESLKDEMEAIDPDAARAINNAINRKQKRKNYIFLPR